MNAISTNGLVYNCYVIGAPLYRPHGRIFQQCAIKKGLAGVSSSSRFTIRVFRTNAMFPKVSVSFLSCRFHSVLRDFLPPSLCSCLPHGIFFAAVGRAMLRQVNGGRIMNCRVAFSFRRATRRLLFIFRSLRLRVRSRQLNGLLNRFMLRSRKFAAMVRVERETISDRRRRFLSFLGL